MKSKFTKSILAIALGAVTTAGAYAQYPIPDRYNQSITPFEDDFVADAFQGQLLEIALGKYAAENAVNSRVRSFGRIMVLDHSKALDSLKKTAGERRWYTPDTLDFKHLDMYLQLTGKNGTDFDRAYIDMMKDDHQKDLSQFQEAQRRSWDPDIHGFADKFAPVIREHLDLIMDIDASMKDTTMNTNSGSSR